MEIVKGHDIVRVERTAGTGRRSDVMKKQKQEEVVKNMVCRKEGGYMAGRDVCE